MKRDRPLYARPEISPGQQCAGHATVGRLRQFCERWIYSACLCFGLSLAEQQHSGFRYAYSVYQVEYSRNLLFRSGAPDGSGLRAPGGPHPDGLTCRSLTSTGSRDRDTQVEATVHNTGQLGCGRTLERFPQIVTRLAGMTDGFCTTLDCVDTGFLADGMLDQLPLPSETASVRTLGSIGA